MSDDSRKGLPPDPDGGVESFFINKPAKSAKGPVKGLPPDPSGGSKSLAPRGTLDPDGVATGQAASLPDDEVPSAEDEGSHDMPVLTKAGGDWFHSHQEDRVVAAIDKDGWRPELNTGSKFGCGVYLARGQWHPDAKWLIRCHLHLRDDEVLDLFPVAKGFEQHGEGGTEGHFQRYLASQGVVTGRPKVESGDSHQNRSIRDFFLKQGIKAVKFTEHGHEVVVVYDTDVIKIVDVQRL
jgi:hypothetical protein